MDGLEQHAAGGHERDVAERSAQSAQVVRPGLHRGEELDAGRTGLPRRHHLAGGEGAGQRGDLKPARGGDELDIHMRAHRVGGAGGDRGLELGDAAHGADPDRGPGRGAGDDALDRSAAVGGAVGDLQRQDPAAEQRFGGGDGRIGAGCADDGDQTEALEIIEEGHAILIRLDAGGGKGPRLRPWERDRLGQGRPERAPWPWPASRPAAMRNPPLRDGAAERRRRGRGA